MLKLILYSIKFDLVPVLLKLELRGINEIIEQL